MTVTQTGPGRRHQTTDEERGGRRVTKARRWTQRTWTTKRCTWKRKGGGQGRTGWSQVGSGSEVVRVESGGGCRRISTPFPKGTSLFAAVAAVVQCLSRVWNTARVTLLVYRCWEVVRGRPGSTGCTGYLDGSAMIERMERMGTKRGGSN